MARDQAVRKSCGRFTAARGVSFRPKRRFESSSRVRGEESIAELCPARGLAPNLFYRWSREFVRRGSACLATRGLDY